MRKVTTLILGIAFLLLTGTNNNTVSVAASENQQRGVDGEDLPPSPLEAFAARPTTKVTWSKAIGKLETDKSRATVTALRMEDAAGQASVIRGVRIELAHLVPPSSCDWKYLAWRVMCKRANAAVYIEEAKLTAVRDSLERFGTAPLRPGEHISRFSSSYEAGLIVCGYQFTYRDPGDLAKLLTSAINELKASVR